MPCWMFAQDHCENKKVPSPKLHSRKRTRKLKCQTSTLFTLDWDVPVPFQTSDIGASLLQKWKNYLSKIHRI